MSRKCPLTGKKPQYGNNRSHSLRATRRRWDVNLQKTTLMIDGHKVQIRISTSALRTLRKNQKLQASKIPAVTAEPKAEEPKAEAVAAAPADKAEPVKA